MVELKWMRYGIWSAHLHVDGEQACKTKHGNFRLSPMPVAPREPTEVTELTPHGVPFGKSCALCLRVWERHTRPKKEKAPKPPPPPAPLAPLASSTPAPRTRGLRRAERLLQIAREIELLEQRIAQKTREFANLLAARDD